MALGIEIEDRPFAKSTLQMFRAQLILHEKVREVLESSLRLARQSGYLKKRGMRVALDTTHMATSHMATSHFPGSGMDEGGKSKHSSCQPTEKPLSRNSNFGKAAFRP